MKKVLIVASVISFIEWFNKENVDYLHDELECEVHIAVNENYFEDTDEQKTKEYLSKIKNKGIIVHNIEFARSPFSSQNYKAYKSLKKIINDNKFDLIHCHTPTVSMLTRLVSVKTRKSGSIVMYTCHGFHFHNAAPKKNWILYYPVEKFLSRFCDYIVTINKEDYNRAKTFHCKNVRYIPGVGVDINKIKDIKIDKKEYKKKLGIPDDAILILSVGEMIERKNHEVIIRAIAKTNQDNIYYAIAGKGPLHDSLQSLASSLGISNQVKFLGFRKDIPQLCHAADISAFPSRIEGLGLAGIEAMAAGVPLISSNVHGILDYVVNGETGYALNPDDVDGFADAIMKLSNDEKLRESMKEKCLLATNPFEIKNALNCMWDIYKECLCDVKKEI